MIAWCAFQPRTEALATALGGDAHFISGPSAGPFADLLPLRYLRDALATWRLLDRLRPRVVIAITPPVFAPLVAWLWCRGNGARLVMDVHTTAFHSTKWGWALPVHRGLARAAAAVTLHTDMAVGEVAGWGANALLVPDDLPDPSQAAARSEAADRPQVVVAGSLDDQEPVETTIGAARLLPEVQVVFTGDPGRLSQTLRESAPENVLFTGWLDYPHFLGALAAADAVAAFSLDPGIMNRAAFEAIGLGKPLVLSDFPGLRERFGDAPVYCANDSSAMAAALGEALANRRDLEQRSQGARERLQAHRQLGLRRLAEAVNIRAS